MTTLHVKKQWRSEGNIIIKYQLDLLFIDLFDVKIMNFYRHQICMGNNYNVIIDIGKYNAWHFNSYVLFWNIEILYNNRLVDKYYQWCARKIDSHTFDSQVKQMYLLFMSNVSAFIPLSCILPYNLALRGFHWLLTYFYTVYFFFIKKWCHQSLNLTATHKYIATFLCGFKMRINFNVWHNFLSAKLLKAKRF